MKGIIACKKCGSFFRGQSVKICPKCGNDIENQEKNGISMENFFEKIETENATNTNTKNSNNQITIDHSAIKS